MSDTIPAPPMQAPSHLQMWLQHAPAPPERGKNSYDVFISYRSSDRRWAMALYDALRLAGWEPFLDQYELVPGTNLEVSLDESLQASSSGVILWSRDTRDSEWCAAERRKMIALKKHTNGAFKYVLAKLDDTELPFRLDDDLYIDFSDSPEGPRGEGLLGLMCGMRGIARPPEVVALSQKIDEDSRKTLVAIRAAVEAGNPERLMEIAGATDPAQLASPVPLQETANALISMNKCEEALSVLDHALPYFPRSVRLRQLKGLALRRLKRFTAAIEVLSELKAEGHQDPETLGILAAAWFGRFQETQQPLHLRRSRELYRTAFQADPRDYYTGLNAAAKSLILGEADEAGRLAKEVLPLVEFASNGQDFWAACSLGELRLMAGDSQGAATQYQKVIDTHPFRTGDLASTRAQAAEICKALALADADTEKVLAPFRLVGE